MLAMVIMILLIVLLLASVSTSAMLSAVLLASSLLDSNFYISAEYIIHAMLGGIDSSSLFAVPMFMPSGILMVKGGVSKKLLDVFPYSLGEYTAGMPRAVTVTCLFYGVISDSVSATVVTVGSMAIPLLIRMGYDKVFVTATVAVAGGLGVTIPPSIPSTLFGMASGASVGKMFMAGVIPGILIALLLMPHVLYYCKKHGEDKEKIHAEVSVLHEKRFMEVFLDSFWALLTPVTILGCIYSGIAPPTEAAVISVFYAPITFICIYRTLKFRDSKGVLVEAVRTFASILSILSVAVAFFRIITLLQIPEMAGDLTLSILSGKVAVLLVINVLPLVVGMIMDVLPVILILTPILIPITSSLGIDPIQFGIIMVANLAIGFVTSLIGINLFVASSLTDIPAMQIAKEAMPPIIFFLITLLATTFIPQISLLPVP